MKYVGRPRYDTALILQRVGVDEMKLVAGDFDVEVKS